MTFLEGVDFDRRRATIVVATVALVTLMFVSVAPASVSASEGMPSESEPNDGPENATQIDPGTTVQGQTTAGTNPDYYAVNVQEGQIITLSASAVGAGSDTEFDLLHRNGTVLASTPNLADGQSGTTGATARYTGTYYVRVRPYFDATGATYNFSVETTITDPFEPNEDRANATVISDEQGLHGKLTRTDTDWFTFEASTGETINISVFASGNGTTNVYLRNQTGSEINRTTDLDGNHRTITTVADYSGTYYVEIIPKFAETFGATYNLTVDLSSDPSDAEPATTTADVGTQPVGTQPTDGGSDSDGGLPIILIGIVAIVVLVVITYWRFRDEE